MGRWKPDAAGRLGQAAVALFLERGYDGTTVADIAERAGVTPRTFFRHYADKREVLFAGSQTLATHLADAARAAPATCSPLQVITAALTAVAELLGGDREWARQRQEVIGSTVELQERELIKMSALADALTGALRARGVPEEDAVLLAHTGIAVMRVAFEHWVADDGEPSLVAVTQARLARLGALTTTPAR